MTGYIIAAVSDIEQIKKCTDPRHHRVPRAGGSGPGIGLAGRAVLRPERGFPAAAGPRPYERHRAAALLPRTKRAGRGRSA
jgi:hypothetical protein